MALPKEYQELVDEVHALQDTKEAVAVAFAGQQQVISDLSDKFSRLQASGADTEALTAIKADIDQLHELNAQLRSAIPAQPNGEGL